MTVKTFERDKNGVAHMSIMVIKRLISIFRGTKINVRFDCK